VPHREKMQALVAASEKMGCHRLTPEKH